MSDPDALRKLALDATADPDPDGDCVRCHKGPLHIEPGDEPTSLCHHCAHEAAQTLAAALLALLDAHAAESRWRTPPAFHTCGIERDEEWDD